MVLLGIILSISRSHMDSDSEYLGLCYCAISPNLGVKKVFFLENALEYSLYGREFNVFIMFIRFPEVWNMLFYKRHLEKREGFIMPT